MENTKKRKARKGLPKGNTLLFTMLLSNLIILIGRIPFSHMLGEIGMGYYAAVYELFVFTMIITGWYLPQAEAKNIKSKLSRGQVKNAGRVFKGTLMLSIGTGLFVCILGIGFSGLIAEKILLQPLLEMALWIVAPSLLLSGIIGAYRGYFEGMGTVVPTCVSRVLEQIFALVFGLIFAKIWYGYGEKVGNFVQNPNYAPAYAVAGIVLGVAAAQLLILLFLVFVNGTFSGIFKRQLSKDTNKTTDSYVKIIKTVITSGFPALLSMLFVQGAVFADMLLYMHYTNKNTAKNFMVHYGSFYGKYAVVIGIIVCFISFTMTRPAAAIAHYHKREEYRIVKDIFSGALHTFALYGIPAAVLLTVLAEPITGMLFGKAEGTMFLFQVSSSLLLFLPCALFFWQVLQIIGKQLLAVRNGVIAFIAHIAAVILFLNGMQIGIASIAYGYMILFGLMAILNGMSLLRYLKYSPEYIRMFAIPFLAAAISGVLDMLFAKALLKAAGSTITSIVCIILGFIGYIVLVFALKGINERELSKIPGGKMLQKIGQMLHLV